MTAGDDELTRDAETWPLPTRRETLRLADSIGKCLNAGDLVILTGELGAGKTFLVRGVCRSLGLPERVRVTSPTFNLVHEYATRPALLHADLYRLDRAADVRQLGLVSQRDDGWALLVEWGEPFIAELGGDALMVSFSAFPRYVRLSSTGARSAEMLAKIRVSRHEPESSK